MLKLYKVLVQEDIRQQWDRVKDGLYYIYANFGTEWRPEDIYLAVSVGAASLWMDQTIDDGFVILQTKPDAFGSGKSLLVWVAYYQGGNGVEEYLPEIEQMARDSGCTKVEFWSPRRGWDRFAERFGFKVSNVIYTKNI